MCFVLFFSIAYKWKSTFFIFVLSRYEKDVQLFKSKVVDSVKLCNSHLFDQPKIDDPYAIRFVPIIDIPLLTTENHTLHTC